MSARVTLADGRTRPAPDPSRPSDARARPRRAACAADALQVRLRRAAADVRPRRPADGRDLPVRLDVPRDVDRDAARADVGDARAAHVAPAREARPPPRVRDRVRCARRRAGHAHVARRVRAARARHRRPGMAHRRARRVERRARNGARPVSQRVRADGVPGGPVHARGRSPAAPPLRPARPDGPDGDAPVLDLVPAPDDVRLRRARSGDGERARCATRADVVVVPVRSCSRSCSAPPRFAGGRPDTRSVARLRCGR